MDVTETLAAADGAREADGVMGSKLEAVLPRAMRTAFVSRDVVVTLSEGSRDQRAECR